jgi:hypothetical protein
MAHLIESGKLSLADVQEAETTLRRLTPNQSPKDSQKDSPKDSPTKENQS